MNKVKISIVIFMVLVLTSTIIGCMYTATRLDHLSAIPFGLDKDVVQLNVSLVSSLDEEIKDRLLTIIGQQRVTIILDSMDSLGLGVFDSADLVKSKGTKQGKSISRDEFLGLKPVIIVKENSYVHRCTNADCGYYATKDHRYMVVGTYDNQHPLSTPDHEYIYNLFLEDYINGTLYISAKEEVVDAIVALIGKYGCCEIVHSVPINALELLRTDRFFLAMVLGGIFSLFGFSVLLYNILHTQKKKNAICYLLGATKPTLYKHYGHKMLAYLSACTLMGTCVYYFLLFRFQRLRMPFPRLLFLIFTCCTLFYITFTVIFAAIKAEIKEGEEL